MRDDAQKQAVLQARAKKLAQRTADLGARRVLERVMVVAVAQEQVAIPIAQLREVVQAPPVTRVGHGPDAVEGVASLRGELLAVVDLADLLDRGRAKEGKLVAIVETPGRAIALRIDAVVGLRDLHEGDFADGLGTAEVHDLLSAVTDDLVCLLDVDEMLHSKRLVMQSAGAHTARGGLP